MHIISKLFFITNTSSKNLFLLTIVTIVTSFIDILSIGLIFPYTKVILNDYSIFENYQIVNNYLATKSNEQIFYTISFVLIILFIFKFLITIALRYIIIRYTHGKLPSVQLSLAKKYQLLSLSEKNLKKDSDIIRNLKELSEKTVVCLENVLKLIAESVILFTLSIYLMIFSPKIFFILASIIIIFGFSFSQIFRPIVYEAGKNRINSDSKIILLIQDLLLSFKEIRILGKENFFLPMLSSAANNIYKSISINMMTTIIPRYAIELIVILFFVTFTLINYDNSSFLNNTLPSLVVFGVASMRIIPLSGSIIRGWVTLKYKLPIVDEVYSDIKFKSDRKKKNIKKVNFEEIELKNISFEYNNSKNKIFEEINFKIKQKQTIGILGESGSGKTTFINILMGLLDIKKGTFNLNGTVLEEKLYDKIKISYIAQENLVLKESVKKNISLEIDEKLIDVIKLEEAIKFSNFDKVLQKNNLTLNSIIGENGLSLSGGESKRLSIARALYHNCDLLIMDEALNSLDEINKIEIRDNLESIKSRIAMVIISHDKIDLNSCDMIYKIENGKINLLKNYEE
tara:strand:+ start:18868 stop:20580 length:1713 start_codon:yes stop_codon:yes gene_type:complete